MAFVVCAPASAEPDEQRKHDDARRGERDRAQTDRDAADNTVRAIGNQYRITTGHLLFKYKYRRTGLAGLSIRRNRKGISSTAASAVDGGNSTTRFLIAQREK